MDNTAEKTRLGRNSPFLSLPRYMWHSTRWEFFFTKLALTCIPDPVRHTMRDPDPNRPTYGSKEGRL